MNELNQLRAVIFDWAGTTVDFGSRAPMGAFVEIFARFGVAISIPEARGPMGLPKRDHIAALMADEAIATRWKKGAWSRRRAKPISTPSTRNSFRSTLPSSPITPSSFPGLLPVVATLRGAGLKIGSTTGYTRDIMARLDADRRQGRLSARQSRLRGRSRRRPADAADDVSLLCRSRRLSAMAGRQSRRHRAGHCGSGRGGRLGGRRHLVGQWLRLDEAKLAALRPRSARPSASRVGAGLVAARRACDDRHASPICSPRSPRSPRGCGPASGRSEAPSLVAIQRS